MAQWFFLFFFNDTATTEIYTLSLHDALPIYLFDSTYRNFSVDVLAAVRREAFGEDFGQTSWTTAAEYERFAEWLDRKSTRLNSSHLVTSYAVFCLQKKLTDPAGGRVIAYA